MKKLIIITAVVAVCVLVYMFKPWPIYDKRDGIGVPVKAGLVHLFNQDRICGEYLVLKPDKEKIPPGITYKEAVKIGMEQVLQKTDSIDGPEVSLWNNRIIVYSPGIKAVVQDKKVNNRNPSVELRLDSCNQEYKVDLVAVERQDGRKTLVKNKPFITNGDVLNATVLWSMNRMKNIRIELTPPGAKALSEAMDKMNGCKFVVMVDERVYFTLPPNFRFIEPGVVLLHGVTEETANDLAIILQSGINIPLKVVGNKVVGRKKVKMSDLVN